MTHILIIGAGYSGRAFAAEKADRAAEISGTTRSPAHFERLRAAGVKPLLFDGETIGKDPADRLRHATHLIVSSAPAERGDPLLVSAAGRLPALAPNLAWIGYLSTVGVYGDHDGDWIDEASECRPTSQRSLLRIAAERDWLDLGEAMGVPVAILRLSGIYGPGRNAFVNLANGTAKRLIKPGQVFNRIHVADIAGALWHLSGQRLGGIFNITDDLPAPPQDVVTYAAKVMGVEPPPELDFDTAELSPMARSFYGENKRVSNAAIRATGYAFRYPNYFGALDALWREGDWSGEGGDGRSPMKRS